MEPMLNGLAAAVWSKELK